MSKNYRLTLLYILHHCQVWHTQLTLTHKSFPVHACLHTHTHIHQYIHTHLHTRTHTHTPTHLHTLTYTPTYLHTLIHINQSIYTPQHVYTLTHAHQHIHTHSHTPTCPHTHTYTCTHFHGHLHTHSYGHLHIHTLSEDQDSPPTILVKSFNYTTPTPVINSPPPTGEMSGLASQGYAPRPSGQDVHIWQARPGYRSSPA